MNNRMNIESNCACCGTPVITGLDSVSKTIVCIMCRDVLAKLSMTNKVEEPLAVSLSKAGYWHHKVYEMADGTWMIVVGTNFRNDLSTEERFKAPTYAAAEQLARKYLEGLNDKENEK